MSEIQVNVRIKKEIKEGLELIAKAQNRSLNNLIVTILGEYLNDVSNKVRTFLIDSLRNLSEEEIRELMKDDNRNTIRNKGRKNDHSRAD